MLIMVSIQKMTKGLSYKPPKIAAVKTSADAEEKMRFLTAIDALVAKLPAVVLFYIEQVLLI